jgi:hypothetical protein
MEHKLMMNEFFIEGGNRDKSHVLLHITEPSTEEEMKKGFFFAICELNHAGTKQIIAIQNIIDEIESNYYEAPEKFGENTLEIVLKNINRKYKETDLFGVEKHCVVGVIKQPEIFFSSAGSPIMHLYYNSKDAGYKTMDLISTEESSSDGSRLLFSQLVQGKISINDYVFIGTPNLSQYFTSDRLQKIIISRPTNQSAQHIERVLSDIKNELSFGGLIIHLEKSAEQPIKKQQPALKIGSEKSLHNFFETEKNTANTLSPSVLPRINDKLKNIWDIEKEENETPISIEQKTNSEIHSSHLRQRVRHAQTERKTINNFVKIIKVVIILSKYLGLSLWWAVILTTKIMAGAGKGIVLLFFAATNYQNRRKNILDNWNKKINFTAQTIKHLPFVTKILLATSLIVAIIFSVSIFYMQTQKTRRAEESRAQETLRGLISYKDMAESALIYKDEAGTISASQNAKQLLQNLNCEKYAKECSDFNEQFEKILSQIRKQITVQPELLSDLSTTLQNTQFHSMAKINNQIIILPETGNKILSYNLLTNQTKIIETDFENFNAISVPKENDYAAILYDNKNIALYNPQENTIKKSDISYPRSDVKITSIVIYNRRAYTLDILNNQIYKHDSVKSGFMEGKQWIKNSTADLKDGTSITIDGDLFVSKQNGTVAKFNGGNLEEFNTTGLDPAIKTGGEIWTYTDKLNIYLLDPAGKRLVVLEKNGKIKNQYTTKEWTAPISMIIDEENKRAFILDNNRLYQFGL